MKKVLFMHNGSGNHGCEALVRTTSKLLGGPKDVILWSGSLAEDKKYGSATCLERITVAEELKKYSLPWLEATIRRRLLKQSDANMKVFLRELFRGRLAVSIGGDNYCYPWSAKEMARYNREIRRHGGKTVLWGCSIDPEAVTPEVREDLADYDLITAREVITYELLKEINPNTIKVADPAFLLEREDLPLPENFIEGNTVGINVSPLIMKYGTEGNLILKNYENMIRFILVETDMNVALIPHVVWECNDDREPLRFLYEKFKETGRAVLIEDANCCELKGFIARCRFFVGARTHATIAAYSTLVPTLVVGYSVKSRGIARDLFGAEEHFVLPVQGLTGEDELAVEFRWLLEHEEQIRRRLERVIPQYKEQVRTGLSALNRLLHEIQK